MLFVVYDGMIDDCHHRRRWMDGKMSDGVEGYKDSQFTVITCETCGNKQGKHAPHACGHPY